MSLFGWNTNSTKKKKRFILSHRFNQIVFIWVIHSFNKLYPVKAIVISRRLFEKIVFTITHSLCRFPSEAKLVVLIINFGYILENTN